MNKTTSPTSPNAPASRKSARRSTALRLAPFAAVLSIAAVACGGSDASSDTTVAPVATAEQTANAAEPAQESKTEEMSESMSEEMSESMTEEMSEEMSDTMSADAMTESEMSEEPMSEDMSETMDAMAGAEFQHLPLVDTAGNEFTLNDLRGKPVFVETFATWCPKCRSQLTDTNAAAGEVGDGAVFVAISVENQLSPEDIAAYAEENGFSSVRFAVITPEFLAAVTDHYGGDAANPPSTPHFIIDSHGVAGELQTGTESASDIAAAIGATS